MYAVLDLDDAGLMGPVKKVRSMHASDGMNSNSMTNVICFKCHKRGHVAKQCKSSGGHPLHPGHPVVCYNCEDEGHIRPNCPYEMRALTQDKKSFGPKTFKQINDTQTAGNDL